MAEEIRSDYDKLAQVSSQFEAQAAQISEMIQKVKAAYDKLENGGWMGRGSDAFCKEMKGVVFPATKRLEAALKTGSQVTKEISQKMKQAEEEASSPFKQSLF